MTRSAIRSPIISPRTFLLPPPSPLALDEIDHSEPFDPFHLRELEAMGIDTCPIGPPGTGWFDSNPDEMEEQLESMIWKVIVIWGFLLVSGVSCCFWV